jgi:hypothetical protein
VTTYFGECYCGAVKFSCEGKPFFTQYCHCNKCREIGALSRRDVDKSNYAWTAGYLTSSFKITTGLNNLEEIIRNKSKLLLCRSCHSLIYGISLDTDKQAGIGINVNNFRFSDSIPESFNAVRHIWYVNRIKDIDDQLPKFKDAPSEQSGSGELFNH